MHRYGGKLGLRGKFGLWLRFRLEEHIKYEPSHLK
jgi:hypothetical protein